MSDPDLNSPTATLEASPADIERETQQHRRRMTLNMGPQHPSTHGVLRVLLELDGETIITREPDIGFLHTGIEKECEVKTWQQAVPLTDRVDYLRQPHQQPRATAWRSRNCWAFRTDPAARAVDARDAHRADAHQQPLVWLGTHALDIGAMTVFLYCFREREEILRIFEMFSGQRMMTSYFRIGGLALEPPRGWQKRVQQVHRRLPREGRRVRRTCSTRIRIWIGRTKGVGFVPLEDMLDLGCHRTDAARRRPDVGHPQGRAVLQLREVRLSKCRRAPKTTCTPGIRCAWKRCGRARASSSRRSKACRPAPGSATCPDVVLPDREKMKTQMEALIYHFKIVTEGFRVPEGEVLPGDRIAARRDRLLRGQRRHVAAVPRASCARRASAICRRCRRWCEGTLIADVIASMGSMDFVLGDMDR